MKKRVVTLGEVLMRLTTNKHERFIQTDCLQVNYGGTEANVAISLSNWGIDTTCISAFPENDLGKAACNYLKQYGVDTEHIQYNNHRMGLYFLENGTMQRTSKIIYDRFDSAFANINPSLVNWDEILEGADWFHWAGITAAISSNAAQLCLDALTVAHKKGITVSGDINYRRNLWQYGKTPLEIMPALIEKSNVIISGLVDFENCLDIKEEDYFKTCAAVQKAYPSITKISTTIRTTINASHNKLSAILWEQGVTIKSKEYDMTHIIDRIGGGDAFMAGLIYGLLYKTTEEALEFAVASSVLKHSIHGDANFVSVDEVTQLSEGKNIGKLFR